MNPQHSQQHAYLRTKVMTARPEELRLMLFDGAIRFAERARHGIETKNHEQAFDGVSRCQDILMELINSLRPEHDVELCENLSALYTYMFSRLMEANRDRDIAAVDEVLQLLNYERETWAMLVQKLADENVDSSAAADDIARAARLPGDGGPFKHISIQG